MHYLVKGVPYTMKDVRMRLPARLVVHMLPLQTDGGWHLCYKLVTPFAGLHVHMTIIKQNRDSTWTQEVDGNEQQV